MELEMTEKRAQLCLRLTPVNKCEVGKPYYLDRSLTDWGVFMGYEKPGVAVFDFDGDITGHYQLSPDGLLRIHTKPHDRESLFNFFYRREG